MSKARQVAARPEIERRRANDGNVLLEGVPDIPPDLGGRVSRYQHIRFATMADWAADGGIYILTRFAEVAQLHKVAGPGRARIQLTFEDEPVLSARRRPGGDDLLLSMDEGGSEFWQLFLFDPKSAELRRITDGTSRNGEARWSPDGRRIAFTSTRRDGRSNDVWVMEAKDPGSARMLVEAGDGAAWAAADWSPDGLHVLITRYLSITRSELYLADVATDGVRRIAGDDEPASWMGCPPRFLPDGRSALVSTDVGGQFNRLARLDLQDGSLDVLTGDVFWDVETVEIAPDGVRALFATNEHGYSRLHLLDLESGSHECISGIPDGVLSDLRFQPGGGADFQIAFTLSPPAGTPDVWTLTLAADGCSADPVRWTESELGGLDPRGLAEPELITYPTFDDRQIPAFVSRPPDSGPHPVIIQIHGGPESQTRPGLVPTYQMWIDELGAAVVRPNVRGSSGYGRRCLQLDDARLREDSVRDIGTLLDWIAEQPDLDEGRVMVYGGSYGGYMVLASLVHFGDRLRGGVDVVGISNFVTFLENTQEYRRDLRRTEYGDERDPEMRDFLQRISPSTNAHRIRTPLLVAQGNNDPRVPASESRQIVDAVRANGVDVWYMNALNEGHGFRRKDNQELFAQLSLLFFQIHLQR